MKVPTYFSRLCLHIVDDKLNVDHDVPFNYRVAFANALVTLTWMRMRKHPKNVFYMQRCAWTDGTAVAFAQCKWTLRVYSDIVSSILFAILFTFAEMERILRARLKSLKPNTNAEVTKNLSDSGATSTVLSHSKAQTCDKMMGSHSLFICVNEPLNSVG